MMLDNSVEAAAPSLSQVPSVVVITASVGRAALRRCAESVQVQDYITVRHLVVVDGPDYSAGATRALADVSRVKQLDVLVLPQNTGHSHHFGYRIYGALPLLADDDVVCYLDEDNWFEPEHVASGIDAMTTTGASWAYALRRICSDDGKQICADDCDSLGYWPKFATMMPDGYLETSEAAMHRRYPNLVDSSCYFLPRRIACTVASLWQAPHADSVVPSFLVRRYAGACSGKSTVNYALGGSSGTPAEWFTEGNDWLRARYGQAPLPWRRRPRKLPPGIIGHPGVAPAATPANT
jgi:glycosyltransferase involved in cell wall biosynthesis